MGAGEARMDNGRHVAPEWGIFGAANSGWVKPSTGVALMSLR